MSSNVILLEELKRRLPQNCGLVIPSSLSGGEILRLVEDVDIIVGTRVSRKLITSARKLKMIQTIGTGVDGIDVDANTERGVIV